MTQERLQKILARAGYGSRRACEQLIMDGRVMVNQQVVGLGDKADPQVDVILVDHKRVNAPEKQVYIIIYKPRNILSAVSSPDVDRRTVRDLIDVPETIYPVGRLDVDSEGLMLMTNDGDLANQLTHPRYEHEKEYQVLVARHPDEAQLAMWRRGVVLEDGYHTQPAECKVVAKSGKGAWMKVVLKEGRKRQIREMGKVSGLPVVRIIRVRMASLHLGRLKPGEWRMLTTEELAGLKDPQFQPGKMKVASTRKPANRRPKKG